MQEVHYKLLIKLTEKIPKHQQFLVWTDRYGYTIRFPLSKKDIKAINKAIDISEEAEPCAYLCFKKPRQLSVFSLDKKIESHFAMNQIYNLPPIEQIAAIKYLDI